MDIYKFKDVPATTHFQVPFDLTEKALNQWLVSLENNLDAEKSRQIFLAIQAINDDIKLSITKKAILLESFYHQIPVVLNSLKKTILLSALPLSSKELSNIRHIVWIYAELANGFKSCITKKSSRANAQNIFYGIQSLISAYIHISEVYQQAYADFWKQSYFFYGIACKLEIQELNIKQDNFDNATISNAFKQLLALYHCSLDQFRPRDILMISSYVKKQAPWMLIEKNISNRKASRYSGLDLKTDTPPTALVRLEKTEKSALRFFSAYAAATQIYKNAAEEATGSGIIRAINYENIRLAAKTLSLSQKRQFTRFNEQKITSGIIGLPNIINELAKTSSLTIATPHQSDTKAGRELKANQLELVPEGFESVDSIKNAVEQGVYFTAQQKHSTQAKKVFNANNKAYSHDKNIWTDTSGIDQQSLSPDNNSDFDILDSSISGYKIIFDTYENTSRVQIGDIIGIKKDSAIEVGIICRILQLTENKLQLGIKLLALESEIAYLSLSRNDSIHTRALFLPAIKELSPISSLVFNDNRFQVKDSITLHRADDKKFSCCLSKPLHTSYAATHYGADQLKPI